jgi:hypothetical protein
MVLMAIFNYKKSSPWATTDQASWYLGTMNYRAIPRANTDQFIVVQGKYDKRPDLLSYDLYGKPDYWWTFMVLNPDVIKDPIFDFTAGIQIYTATRDRLSDALGG